MFSVSAHCMMHQLYMTMSISTWILLSCMDLRTVNKITNYNYNYMNVFFHQKIFHKIVSKRMLRTKY